MAVLDWPAAFAFAPRRADGFAISLAVPRSSFQAFYTGDTQSVSHAADRLRITLQLPPCSPADAAQREAFFNGLVSTGDWVRLYHFLRPEPAGTLRGSLAVQTAAAAGAMAVQLQGGNSGGTLLAGDLLGTGSQLLPVAYAGAAANGAGQVVVPLQRPLQRALAPGQVVQWLRPAGTFQLAATEVSASYGPGGWQRPLTLPFREVFV